MRSVVIIGAGIAGLSVAEGLRDDGYDGPIALVGDEPDAPYDRPPLSKEVLTGTAAGRAPLRPEDWYVERRIELILGDAATELRDGTVTLASGRTLAFDNAVLATGSRARRLPLLDAAGIDAHYLRTAGDADRLRAALRPGSRLGVIGAGVIGLEVAATARAMGLAVTVLEQGERAMARALSPSVSRLLAEHHRAAGIDLRFGTEIVTARADPDDGATLMLASGEVLRFDALVVGIGAVPDTALARRAGLAVADGVLVDAKGRTNRPGIFAAGDVARFPCAWHGRMVRLEQWQHAVSHGRAVAAAMLGHGNDYAQLPWFWSDQRELSLQLVGRADTASEVRRADGLVAFHLDEGRLVGATTINLPRLRRPLAVLVECGAVVDPAILADPATDLKRLAASMVQSAGT